jgi:hypothetical protein
MRNARFWRLAVIITTAGGLSLAGAGTALAGGAARADVDVSIATTSAFVPVSHDTLVRYGAPAPADTATVSGSVTGIPADLTSVVVTLLDKPFGAAAFSTGPQDIIRPDGDGSAAYSFSVTPDLATSYEVQVSASGHNAPLVTSAAQTVYVIPDVTVTGGTACRRPTCQGDLAVTARFPPAAFATESVKHLRLYGGLRKSAGGTPAGPDQLHLSGWANTAVPHRNLGTMRYNVGYQFNVGTEGYQWKINYCTPDTETKDGIGLPGHHGCGDQAVSAAAPYLG